MDTATARWIRGLPDDPAHVEARGLAARGARVVESGDAGVVIDGRHDLAVLVGPASSGLAEPLLAASPAELHAAPAHADGWCELLGLERRDDAILHSRPSAAASALERLVRHDVAPVEGADDPLLGALPRSLAQELLGIRPFPRAFVALAGAGAAALAYAFVESKSWLDVSIDTLTEYRRRGFGTSAAAARMADGCARGRGAVWGADPNNAASLALARRLGFERCGGVAILVEAG
ncbi:MAG: GNAT family N-acetyltransferase [Planctomycetota bacterium]|nr:GNAT family N-acetyltransferase [Planctomycetota bacterium]